MFDTPSSQHKQGRNIPAHITEYVRDLSLYGFRHGWIRGSGDSKSQPFFSAPALIFLYQFGFQAASPHMMFLDILKAKTAYLQRKLLSPNSYRSPRTNDCGQHDGTVTNRLLETSILKEGLSSKGDQGGILFAAGRKG